MFTGTGLIQYFAGGNYKKTSLQWLEVGIGEAFIEISGELIMLLTGKLRY